MDRSKIQKMWVADQGDGTYINPILYTDYSDPDAIRVGEDYFMIASSFCNSPAVPLLHSKDLVNWKVINYIIDKLPFERYEKPIHGCGTWAPSIRFHEGVYYAFIPFPDEGIMMCKTMDPWGEWSDPSFVRQVVGWIDPCPFWDDDGKAYMVSAFARSRIGFKSFLYMSPIEPDCSGVLDDGQFIYDGHATQPTIEGPKLYKRNGYYYIFAPAGGVKPGWQTVLRSKNIYGPYEERIVLSQGGSPVNGPHQGAWVDTPDGQDWFLHFQDVGNAGRIIHLQPMRWEDDWPVIGVNDRDGCGEPVMRHVKPATGADCLPDAPEDSDFFEGEKLGLQWQWNANYKKEWYDLSDNSLILHAQPADPNLQLCDTPNLLIQKWPAPDFKITTLLHLDRMQEGDMAGMVSQCGHYTGLAVVKRDGKYMLCQRTGDWTKDNEARQYLEMPALQGDVICLRMRVRDEKYVSFEAGANEEHLIPVGETVEATPGRWVGVKAGLFAVNESGRTGGSVAAEYFVFERNE
ncbi:MAG: glycoside hydrolase 43 family protein [Clostridium sp.]|nr:glycoside hydrolase 43 family protein [Acetatifactor muris]MCM1526835.1 glycoside hydrolase 43 family protein [Bacteroides sp.]MCM1562965.1 glycoside hydrolase 43 family protein [Clostridium sp.]